jgi:hypothetical protein
MCAKDPEPLRLLREVVTGEAGDNQHTEVVDNVNDRSGGNAKDYTLDRLAREDPGPSEPRKNAGGRGTVQARSAYERP